ncbi:MAG TPA: hypothetical protein VF516_02905 [Kofleriaceae bacterium]
MRLFFMTTLLAACANASGSATAEGALSASIVCLAPIGGWNVKLQGSTWNDEADAIAADNSDCAIYLAGDTVNVLPGATSFGGQDAFLIRYNSSGSVVWTRQFGSLLGSDEAEWATGVAVSANHEIYVTGCTTGQMTNAPETNAGGTDVFLAKYDHDGNQLWIHQFGTTTDDCSTGVAVGVSGGVFVVGSTHAFLPGSLSAYFGGADAFLVKYSSAGVRQFTQMLGSPVDDEASAVAIGPSGNVYVTGDTEEDLPRFANFPDEQGTRNGGADIFLAKYDPTTGAPIWLRQRGTSGEDRANGVVVNDSNEVFLTGYTNGWFDGIPTHGLEDIVVISYDTAGTWRWTDQRGSLGDDRGTAITVDSSGTPFVTGYASSTVDGEPYAGGTSDVVVIKYGRAGVHRWTADLGERDNERPTGIAAGVGDDLFVGGFTDGNLGNALGFGENDAFVARFSQTGDLD